MLIWNTAHGLDPEAGFQIWKGWVFGDVLQALLVVAPLLHFAGPRARPWIDRQFAAPPRYEVTYTRAALIAAVTFSLIAVLVFVGIYTLQESLDLDATARTPSGELLVPRLREMQIYLGVLVAALTVAASVFSNVLARMGERQRGLSRRESLTGCFNRRAFYELFPREVERARRLGQGVAIVFLDIDHFKAINDRYGHETGDRVLQQLSAPPARDHPRDGPALPLGRGGVRDPDAAHGPRGGAGARGAHPRRGGRAALRRHATRTPRWRSRSASVSRAPPPGRSIPTPSSAAPTPPATGPRRAGATGWSPRPRHVATRRSR